MTALSTLITRVRTRIRDPHGHIGPLDDDAMVNLSAGIIGELRDFLQNMESNLVYGEDTITTEADTQEYTPSFDHEGFLDHGVWLDGESWFLKPLQESDKVFYDTATSTNQPEGYYLTEDNKVGFLWIPDDAYTVHVQYWKPVTLPSDTDYTLPWYGIWDACIERMLTLSCLEVIERDVTLAAQHVAIAMGQATAKTYARGTRRRRRGSGMFSVEGV